MRKMLDFIQRVIQRIKLYVSLGEWPWSLRWMNFIYPGLFCHPIKFFSLMGPLMRNEVVEMSCGVQLYGDKILKDALNACEKVNINPFLAYGTLLGFYREYNFIKTDNDVDLGIMEIDVSKLSLLKEKMKKKGYGIRAQSKFFVSFRKKKYHRLHIDFYINFKYKHDNIVYCAEEGPEGSGDVMLFIFPSEVFSAFKEVNFKKCRVLIPGGTEQYLESVYGKDWRIPTPTDEINEVLYFEKVAITCPNYVLINQKSFEKGDYTLKLKNM